MIIYKNLWKYILASAWYMPDRDNIKNITGSKNNTAEQMYAR